MQRDGARSQLTPVPRGHVLLPRSCPSAHSCRATLKLKLSNGPAGFGESAATRQGTVLSAGSLPRARGAAAELSACAGARCPLPRLTALKLPPPQHPPFTADQRNRINPPPLESVTRSVYIGWTAAAAHHRDFLAAAVTPLPPPAFRAKDGHSWPVPTGLRDSSPAAQRS